MKKSVMMTLLAILVAMVCWSCKDDKDEPKYPLTIGDRLYFNPEESIAYNPIALEELPEFVQEELNSYVVKLYGFVYKGIWDGEEAYLIWSDGFEGENIGSCGHVYFEDGTDLGTKTMIELVECSGGWNKWTCVYFWKHWMLQ